MYYYKKCYSKCHLIKNVGQKIPYIVNDHVHDDFGNLIACNLVDDFYVRVDQITDGLDFSLKLRIHGQVHLEIIKKSKLKSVILKVF